MKKRFSEDQIIGFLREVDAGMAVKELCRRHGFSEAFAACPTDLPCLNQSWTYACRHNDFQHRTRGSHSAISISTPRRPFAAIDPSQRSHRKKGSR